MKRKKLILEGEFAGEPEPGRFSYAKTRKMITEKLLSFKGSKSNEDKDVFTEVNKFNVEEDGNFTVEVKISRYIFNQESQGKEKEQSLLEMLEGLEDLFSIGKGEWDTENIKKLQDDGILSVAYFTDLREEDD